MAGVLTGLRNQARALASPQVKADLTRLARVEFSRQIDAGFERETDPYGVPWRKKKSGGGKTLVKSGALRAGVQVISRGNRIETVVTGPARRYGRFHQNGTRNMPRRRFMPDESGIPQAWAQSLNMLSDRYFRTRR